MKTLIELSTEIFNDEQMLLREGAEGARKEKNGCAYNFNRGIDKLCFKNALARFIRTGAKDDAFDVFFCYTEIFKTFGGYTQGIDKLLDLLYQHETNSAALLVKHRDHYSHSAYVFALGLAIFTHSSKLRSFFQKKYGKEKLYENFLKFWGMAALFHDIGYPYEISFQQVLRYGENTDCGIRAQYTGLQTLTALTDEEAEKCAHFLPEGRKDINALFASEMIKNFGALSNSFEEDCNTIEQCLVSRITNADKYMDHGYFSAAVFLKKLLKTPDFRLDGLTLDAVMAMLLHNSFYKQTYRKEIMGDRYKKISAESQPLAYLLMLCDELQCWDRAPYGEISRMQELAWDIDLFFEGDKIQLKYYFDSGENPNDTEKISNLISDICKSVVDCGEIAVISAIPERKKKDKKVYDYMSDGKFINLCKIAEAINVSYNEDCKSANIKEYMHAAFNELTLEYKLSNVAQAKNYVRHLEDINCFFSDRRTDYPVVEQFTEDELEFLAESEHIRWVSEKACMGWKYGTAYSDRTEREQKRIHKDIIPYDDLTEDEKHKDFFPINNMIKHLALYGVKVYRMKRVKPDYFLGCTGHRNLARIKALNEEDVRGQVRAYIRSLMEKYSVKLLCGFAEGADLLFAEEGLKCGADVFAVLPCGWRDFAKEHSDDTLYMQLLGQTRKVVVKPSEERYEGVMRYIVKGCDELLALWDGKKLPFETADGKPVNRAGTYDTILTAEKAGKKVKLFGNE